MATLAKSKKKAQRGKKAHQRPSYADLLAKHLQTEKRNQGKKRKKKRKSKRSKRKHVSESESEPDDEGGRSHRHHHRSKKKKTLIPKPFGTSGKKGTGERGSKGYDLKDHMGLSDSPDHYLDIRSAVREKVTHHRLTGKKRKQDVKALTLICIDVEKKFPELKQFENSWPIHDMITGILCNKSDYSKNKANKENEIPSDNEEHGNVAEDRGDGNKTDHDGGQASAKVKDKGAELADPEDGNENQSLGDEEVVDTHWRCTEDLELDFNTQENPFEGVHQEEDDDEESDVIDPRSQIFEEAPESQMQRGSIIHHYKIRIPARNQDMQNKKKSPPPVATSTRPQLSSSSSQITKLSSQPPAAKIPITKPPQNNQISRTTKTASRSVKRKVMTPVEA
ncbi:hypothetical protein JB92DRAFT_2829071 [Gautieria morchelliformis]|nr:hypothetical protein JB92DRAFT_2829071 [Gautieria morchelliformis]